MGFNWDTTGYDDMIGDWWDFAMDYNVIFKFPNCVKDVSNVHTYKYYIGDSSG
jgi:hypothetical protein